MIKKSIVISAHAFVGWAVCGLTMGIGMRITSLNDALIIHAIVVPITFCLISLYYFRKLHYTSPLKTAVIFLSLIILMDIFIVALLIQKSFEMFTSILGTWVPFFLIFISTYLTGSYTKVKTSSR